MSVGRAVDTTEEVAGTRAPSRPGGLGGLARRRAPALWTGGVGRDTWVRTATVVALLLFVLLALPAILSLYYIDALTQVAVYSVVALGLGVLVGVELTAAALLQLVRKP